MKDKSHELCAVLQVVPATSSFMPMALGKIVPHTRSLSWTLPQGALVQLLTLLHLQHNLALKNLVDFSIVSLKCSHKDV